MNAFEQAGEALFLAEEGKRQLARAVAAGIKGWAVSFKNWLGNMPTTLPPTESIRR